VLAELLERRTVRQFRQNAPANQRGSKIVGDGFLPRQVGRALAGNDRRQLLVGQAAVLRDDDMGIEFIRRAEMRAGVRTVKLASMVVPASL